MFICFIRLFKYFALGDTWLENGAKFTHVLGQTSKVSTIKVYVVYTNKNVINKIEIEIENIATYNDIVDWGHLNAINK